MRTLVQNGGAVLDVSPSGALIYAKGSPPRQELAWLDGTGHIEPLGTPAARYDYGVRFSPDGQRIALSSAAAAFDVWAFDLQRAVMIRLTSAPENDMVPVWTPGGGHVVFMCFREAADNICRVRADGSGGELRLMTAKGSLRPYSFSPDGRNLVFGEVRPDTKGDLWIVRIDDVDGDRPRAHEPVPFLNTPFNEQAAMISPDGSWISYQSDETGTDEIYVRSFPEGSRKTLVSIGGGSAPVWSRTRPELFYRSSDGLNKVTYTAKGGVFAPDKPRAWAPGKGLGQWFDISPTDRAVIISGVEESLPPQLMLVLGFDELRRRATEGVRR